MIIIGAGLSGLLCGALNPGSKIYEAGPKRDTSQQAVFRLRSNRIGKLLGIEFKKVVVQKSIWFEGKEVTPSIQLNHMYSEKVTGKITGRSIANICDVERYIPPVDFAKQLEARCEIIWNTRVESAGFYESVVSTAPLNTNLEICGIDYRVDQPAKDIIINRIPIQNCDTYCTMYYPHPEMNTYRASITGDMLIIEGIGLLSDKELAEICWSLGIPYSRIMMNSVTNTAKKMGKIFQTNNLHREKAIVEMTTKHNFYSLGRFATWRPKVMLDDILDDIYHIQRLIKGGVYQALKHKQNEAN